MLEESAGGPARRTFPQPDSHEGPAGPGFVEGPVERLELAPGTAGHGGDQRDPQAGLHQGLQGFDLRAAAQDPGMEVVRERVRMTQQLTISLRKM